MGEIDRLLKIIDQLRAPLGCPWDREQTLQSLQPQLLDEAYEVLAAVNSLDATNLKEELGDLLFGILMFCRVAEKEGGVPLAEVVRGIEEKIIRRHPHVFGKISVRDADEVLKNWEKIKAREKNKDSRGSIYDDTFKHLPALRRAQRVQKKAARVGFDWKKVSGTIGKIHEELAEVAEEIKRGDKKKLEKELGDLLFSVVNLIRFLNFDAELTLHRMINRWVRRFKKMEGKLREQGRDLHDVPFVEMDRLWEEIAESEKSRKRKAKE